MCQLVATLIHLFSCRYECQKFGFWGAFLAGRFCVYITQMNFLFLPLFLSCFVLFYLIYFTADSCYLSYCILCLLSAGAGRCHFWLVVNVPRYHVATLSICHVDCGCSLKCRRRATLFCGRRFENLPRCEVVLRLKLLQLLGYPSATPAACR